MSQVTQITIDNVAFGTFRSNLNDTLNALNSMHSGTSRPASATTGTIWLDTTNAGSNSLTIKFFDGTDDITVADVDTLANTINFIDSTVSTELLTDLSPQLGGMLDVNGNDIGNGTEELIKFSETASAVNEITVTNSATGNAPEISATGDDTNIDLKLTPKGTGNLNLDGLKFPNSDGTTGQFLKTDGSGNLSFDTAGGGGKVLQVVSATKTDTATNTSTTFTTVSGLSVSITPSSSSSKIYLIMSVSAGNSAGSAQYRFARGGTGIAIGDASSSRTQTTFSAGSEAGNRMYGFGSNFLDSPNTTSATTYSIQWRVQNSGTTIYLNRSPDDSDNESHPRGSSTITVMEIGA